MSGIELFAGRGGPSRPDRRALPVAEVRRVEADAMAALPPGTLMQRAATAVDVICARLLRERTGGVVGRRVVLLVGPGDNGGDALYAGARLARRGARVEALLVASRHHVRGAQALRSAGGRLHRVADLDEGAPPPDPYDGERFLLARSDLVLDGILGIGGTGGLRGAAGVLASAAAPFVVAVDLPSGVDADTGAVAGAAVRADRTLVMGVLKPGLLAGPGAELAGALTVVEIGLDLGAAGGVEVVDAEFARAWLPRPGRGDDKYRRGVVGVSAGSARYPGAAVLCTGAARHGAAGFVRYAGPAAEEVVRRWPDVVASPARPADAGRVQCWVVGPGRGTDDDAIAAVRDVLAGDVPVVLDADALTILAERDDVRAAARDRSAPTVLTPHAGEFARLRDALGLDVDVDADRIGATRALARALGAVVLLKGATTVVAAPGGEAYAVLAGPPELATAGTGDVLSGLLGSLLAHAQAQHARDGAQVAQVAQVAAAAAHLHGIAGRIAARGGRTVAALDVALAVPRAVAAVRRPGAAA